MFTALNWNSTKVSNICCLCSRFSFNSIKHHSLSISYPLKVQPAVSLLCGSLVCKCIPWCHLCWGNHTLVLHCTTLVFSKPWLEWSCCPSRHWRYEAMEWRVNGESIHVLLSMVLGLVFIALRVAPGYWLHCSQLSWCDDGYSTCSLSPGLWP
jgi:hypothetical protein